jgi:hypothetical protein
MGAVRNSRSPETMVADAVPRAGSANLRLGAAPRRGEVDA